MAPVGKYGPLVIGQAQFEAEKEILKSGTLKYGPLVLNGHPSTAAPGIFGDEPKEASSVEGLIGPVDPQKESGVSPAAQTKAFGEVLRAFGGIRHNDLLALATKHDIPLDAGMTKVDVIAALVDAGVSPEPEAAAS